MAEPRDRVVRIEVKRVFHSRDEARRFEAVMRQAIAEAEMRFSRGFDSPSIRSHGRQYLQHLEANGITESRIERVRSVLLRFAREIHLDHSLVPASRMGRPGKPDVHLADVTKFALQEWRQKRIASVKASTANQEIAILKAYASWTLSEDLWIADGRAMLWMRLPRLKHKARRPPTLSPREVSDLAKVLPEHIGLPFLLLYMVGDRPGAI
jgi:hypothetical protein